MSQYTKDISYLNLLMRNSRLLFGLLILCMLGVQLGIMHNEINKISYTAEVLGENNPNEDAKTVTFDWAPTFNALLSKSSYTAYFCLFAFISLLLIPVSSLWARLHSNADYTLNRLTLSPKRQFFLHTIHAYLRILLVVFAELLTVLLAYVMYTKMVDSNYHLVNELTVTYLNNTMFHFLLPITSPLYFIMVLINLFVLAVSTTFASYMLVDKKYAGTVLLSLSNCLVWLYFMLSDGFYWCLFITIGYAVIYTCYIHLFVKQGCRFKVRSFEGEKSTDETN